MSVPDNTSSTPAPGASASAISRRRVLGAAAWATPAVLVATASPPAAASTYSVMFGDVVATAATDTTPGTLQFSSVASEATVTSIVIGFLYDSQAFLPEVIEANGWGFKDTGGVLTLTPPVNVTVGPLIHFTWKNGAKPGTTWPVSVTFTTDPDGTTVEPIGPWSFTRPPEV